MSEGQGSISVSWTIKVAGLSPSAMRDEMFARWKADKEVRNGASGFRDPWHQALYDLLSVLAAHEGGAG